MKQTKADILRSYGLKPTQKLRWNTPIEKGIYWYFFSLFIRARDVEKYGTCISCDRPITVDTCDCGHFIPAKKCGRDLLFDERNNNAECYQCNAWNELHLFGYAKNLDRRYGAGTADSLLARYEAYNHGPLQKDWKAERYAQMILDLRNPQKIVDSI